jgi:hypothetical protein
MLVMIFLSVLVMGHATVLNLTVYGIILFVFLGLFSLLHSGRLKLASLGMVGIGWLLVTVVLAAQGTVRAPNTAAYMLFIFLSGLLFDLQGMAFVAILSSLAVAGLILAENNGLLPRPNTSAGASDWLAYSILFTWISSLTYISILSTRHALERAQAELYERRRAEAAVRKLLDEKELLLREINHRIKNTLFLISSLLNLQAEDLEDQAAVQAFLETSSRVNGMSILYDTLSDTENFLAT